MAAIGCRNSVAMATQLQLAPSRLDFSQDVFEILNQMGRGEIERVTFR